MGQGPPRPAFAGTAFLTYGTNIAAATLSLLNVLIVSRALGPSGRGDMTFLITISMLTSTMASLGIQQASANFAGAEPAERPALAANAAVFAASLGLVSAGFVAGLVAVFPGVGGHAGTALRWLALGSIPLMILRLYFAMLVQADYGFRLSNTAWLAGPVTNVVVNGALAASHTLTVGAAVGAWIGGQALGVALMTWYLWRRLAGFGKPNPRLAWRSLRFGLKAHAGNVMLIGNYRLDQWLLGAISSFHELGLYSVAVAWAEALFFLPQSLTMVLRPDLVRAAPSEAARQAVRVFRAAVWLTLPLAVLIAGLAPVLCVTIFGGGFRGSIADLRLLVPGAFGIVTLKVLGNALTAQGKPMLETAAIGIAFVTTVVLDALLIPRYGGTGAAFASTIAYTVGGLAAGAIFVRALNVPVAEVLPRVRDVPLYVRSVRRSLSGAPWTRRTQV